MKIGILQAGHLEESLKSNHGDMDEMFARLLAGHDFEFENYIVVDGQFPDSEEECDGWLVTGSIHGAYEDLPWIPPLEEFIRNSYAKNIPVAGICFGHQIMAQALGGRVEKCPQGWGIGHSLYETQDNTSMALLACHQDQVVELPPEAEVILKSEFCANAGLAYKRNAMSFQPHPEFTPEFMRDLVEYKISQGFSKETGDAALEKISDNYESAKIAAQLAAFYLQADNRKITIRAAE